MGLAGHTDLTKRVCPRPERFGAGCYFFSPSFLLFLLRVCHGDHHRQKSDEGL